MSQAWEYMYFGTDSDGDTSGPWWIRDLNRLHQCGQITADEYDRAMAVVEREALEADREQIDGCIAAALARALPRYYSRSS